MANIAIFRINYKSDFILTLQSDAGWAIPFCIKFWTGAPSQAYFVGYDGTTYTHCAPVEGEPTKLVVQFDDHHLPIGDLKFQIGYHFTVADFPTSVEDEVLNQASVIIEVDDVPAQVMLDLNGETAPEIEFSLPAYANEEQRIAHEQQRIANEDVRIAAEETRQQNEQQRINQETARVSEFATLKSQSQAATRDANNAAVLANDKAQLAADKAALAQAAATLANEKAQLAADKAALANDAAQLAADKAALAQQKAEYAQQQGSYAKDQGDYAKNQGDYAKAQGDTAQADHERAETDHGIAADDHTQAGNDHTRAESDHGIAADDHTQAGNDHTRAESDHGIAADDHTQAGNDHTRAESDHGIAADDHTQAGNDHTRAESDHTRAESDHAAVEVYVDSLGAFDISAYNATGGVLAKYADLTAALGTNGANIPDALRKGGMSVKYVQTYDNKYVQARCMAQNFTTDVSQWQGEDDKPTGNSNNLVISDGLYKAINMYQGATLDIKDILTWQLGTIRNGAIAKYSSYTFAVYLLEAGYTITVTTMLNTAVFPSLGIASSSNVQLGDSVEIITGNTYSATEDTYLVICRGNGNGFSATLGKVHTLVDDIYTQADDAPHYNSEKLSKSKSLYNIQSDIHGGIDYTINYSYNSGNGGTIGTAQGLPAAGVPAGTTVRWYINKAGSLTNAYIEIAGVKSAEMLEVGNPNSYYQYILSANVSSFNGIKVKNASDGVVPATVTLEVMRNGIVVTKEEYNPVNSVKATNMQNDSIYTATGDGNSRAVIVGFVGPNYNASTHYDVMFVKSRIRCSKACTIYGQFSANATLGYYRWRDSMENSYVILGRQREFIYPTEIPANTYVDVYGVFKGDFIGSAQATRTLYFAAIFDDAESANGVTLEVDKSVILSLTETFGAGNEPDKNTIYDYLKAFENRFFVGTVELVKDKLHTLNNHSNQMLNNYSVDGSIQFGDYGDLKVRNEINPNWPKWGLRQYIYGQSPLRCPIPMEFHGKLETDSLVSVIPIWGNWGPKAVTTSGDNWGGHVFHGWNSRMTYRLTMMASGGMTAVEEDKREDEFCLHVFSPAGAYANPVGDVGNLPRITQEQEDIFSGGAYYGRLRIGADKGDEGFVFRANSMTCYGRINMNGQKFILGSQTNVPLTSASAGVKGEVSFDDNYLYIHIGTKWKRIALEDF